MNNDNFPWDDEEIVESQCTNGAAKRRLRLMREEMQRLGLTYRDMSRLLRNRLSEEELREGIEGTQHLPWRLEALLFAQMGELETLLWAYKGKFTVDEVVGFIESGCRPIA